MDRYSDDLLRCIKKALAERDQRIADLEVRLKTMESRPELKYMGIWRHDGTYSPGA